MNANYTKQFFTLFVLFFCFVFYANAGKILIFGPRLNVNIRNEAIFAKEAGHTVTVVGADQWKVMTTAQFASYDAIIIPDPGDNIPGIGNNTLSLQVLNDTKAVWSPAIMGKVFIWGTDPIWHNNEHHEAEKLMTNAINFITNSPGTGLYFALGLDYWREVENTPIDFLSLVADIKVGGITDEAIKFLFPKHPIFRGVTEAGLSEWSNSAHAVFNTFPSTFLALATPTGTFPYMLMSATQPGYSITTNLLSASYCAGSYVSISYTAIGVYAPGNVFTAQLSNADGQFFKPTDIGSVTSVNSGIINATIPAGVPVGSHYIIRVIASSPLISGTDNGTDINILSAFTLSDQVFCRGSNPDVNSLPPGDGTNTYTWYADYNSTTRLDGAVLLHNGDYYVSRSGACANGRTKVTIILSPIIGAQVICKNNATIKDLPQNNNTYKWYIDANSTTSLLLDAPLSPGVQTLYVSQKKGTCETDRTAVQVTVAQPPAPPNVTNQSVCVTYNGTIVNYPTIGSLPRGDGTNTYKWYVDDDPNSTYLPSEYTIFQNGTYYVSQSNGTCESSRTAVTVSTPSVDFVDNQEFCNNTAASVNFTGTATSYSWTNDNTSIGLAASGTGNISFTANPGSTLIVATITVTPHSIIDGVTCDGTAMAFTITVYPPLIKYTVMGGTYCSGGSGVSIQLSGSQTGATYSLLKGSSTIASLEGTGDPLVFLNVTEAGEYRIEAIYLHAANPCVADMGTATVTVYPTPAMYTVTGGGRYCAGDVSIQLSGSETGVTYSLLKGSSTIASLEGTGDPLVFLNVTEAGEYRIEARYNDAANPCVADMGTATVSINPIPDVNAIPSATYCNQQSGAAITFSSSVSGTHFIWESTANVGFGNVSTGDIPAFTARNNSTIPVVATVSVTPYYINGGVTCTGTPQTFTITVNPTPAPPDIEAQSFCSLQTPTKALLPPGNGTYTYNWYAEDGYTKLGDDAPITTGAYYVSQGIGSCEGDRTRINIIANKRPTGNISGPNQLCSITPEGVNITLPQTENDVTYRLLKNGNPSSFAPAKSTSTDPLTFSSITEEGLYTIEAITEDVSCAALMNGSVEVKHPSAPVVADQTYCSGTLASSLPQGNGDYKWYRNNTNSCVIPPIPSTEPLVTGTYYASQGDKTCGESNRAAVKINIINPPAPPSSKDIGPQVFCNSDNPIVDLLPKGKGIYTYKWYSTDGTLLPLTAALPISTDDKSYSYLVSQSNGSCESSKKTPVKITVMPTPAVFSISNAVGPYCSKPGVSISLSNFETGFFYTLVRLVGNKTTVVNIQSQTKNNLPITFPKQTVPGVYTVRATSNLARITKKCAREMAGSVTVLGTDPPRIEDIGAQVFCSSDYPTVGSLPKAPSPNTYLWYTTLTGGTPLDNGQAISSNYYYVSQKNVCGESKRTKITVIQTPAFFVVSSIGNLCSGGTGVSIMLNNSEPGVDYTLIRNKTTVVGKSKPGSTNTPLTFPVQKTAGVYTVRATTTLFSNAKPKKCVRDMTGSVTVVSMPAAPSSKDIGAQVFCSSDHPTVASLPPGKGNFTYNYYLEKTGGTPLQKTDALFAGDYYVSQYNSCGESNRAPVTIIQTPAVFNISNAGTYCSTTGVRIMLNNSETGVDYRFRVDYTLVKDGVLTGTVLQGTNTPLTFPVQKTAGVYTVRATTTLFSNAKPKKCVRDMTGSVTVVSMPAAPSSKDIGAQVFCSSDHPTVASLPPGKGIFTYNWYSAKTGDTPLPTTDALPVSSDGKPYYYYVSQKNACCESSESSRTKVSILVKSTCSTLGAIISARIEDKVPDTVKPLKPITTTPATPLSPAVSTPTVSVAAAPVAKKAPEAGSKLQVTAFPNPTHTNFTLQLHSSSDKGVNLTVVDVLGRVIEMKGHIAANGTLQIGHLYRPGTYLVVLQQGSDRVTVKVIKQAQ
jgi:hypothetical protein